jgi:hypothetical protein
VFAHCACSIQETEVSHKVTGLALYGAANMVGGQGTVFKVSIGEIKTAFGPGRCGR